MTAWLIVCTGLLVIISIAIGASLDTTTQRRERQRLAGERHRRNEDTADQRQSVLCAHCPLRHLP